MLDVLVEVVEQRAFVKGAAPLAVAVHEGGQIQLADGAPARHIGAARGQEPLQALDDRHGPDQLRRANGENVVDVGAQIEAQAHRTDRTQRKLRAHVVQ